MTNISLKQALYRAHHRGSKEADVLFGGFMELYAHDLKKGEIEDCARLFNFDDAEIFLWTEDFTSAPPSVNQKILLLLKAYVQAKKRGEESR